MYSSIFTELLVFGQYDTQILYRIDMALIVVWGINILSGLAAMGYSIGGIEALLGILSLHSITATIGYYLS